MTLPQPSAPAIIKDVKVFWGRQRVAEKATIRQHAAGSARRSRRDSHCHVIGRCTGGGCLAVVSCEAGVGGRVLQPGSGILNRI